jgi:hypothetical protein
MLATPVSVINSDQITSNWYVWKRVSIFVVVTSIFLGSVSKCGYRCYAPRFLALTKRLLIAGRYIKSR